MSMLPRSAHFSPLHDRIWPERDDRWFVLRGPGGWLGKRWQIDQNTITRPRLTMVESLDWRLLDNVILCHGQDEAMAWASQARQVLGIEVRPVQVTIEGRGKDGSKIVEVPD
jgi:hypothetical protein